MAVSDYIKKYYGQQTLLGEPVKKSSLLRDTVEGLPRALSETLGQPTLRAYAGIGSFIANRFGLSETASLKPQGEFQKKLFGTDRPISLASVGEEVGVPKGSAFAAPVGLALGAADLVPGGGTTKLSAKTAFKGAKTLTTKILERLKGKSVVSKQFIEDLTNAGDIKQAERDLFRSFLDEEGGKIAVPKFANKVEASLLPLKGNTLDTPITRYENITLPDDLRGTVANYEERIYSSPIKTSAGDVHFSGFQGAGENNYFAHTRVEDLPVPTRRVIELQSDLFQKGRLEGELENYKGAVDAAKRVKGFDPELGKTALPAREKDLAEAMKLEPYRNIWHERVIREEVKQAAIDGKTKLQFPTGETAMKIEGLGQQTQWRTAGNGRLLQTGDLKVGSEINSNGQSDWIITEVLGDGKFRAVPRRELDFLSEDFSRVGIGGPDETIESLRKGDGRALGVINDRTANVETFDISGKIDTDNPIYRFYEKEVGRYLKNKYGAKQIVDPQGVKWMELNVPQAVAKTPVEAFGAVGGIQFDEEGNIKFSPEGAALGVLGVSGSKFLKDRGFIKSAQKLISNTDRIGGQYIPRSTSKLAIKAKNLIKDDLLLAEKLALSRSDDAAVATASELLKKYADDAAKATDPATANALYDKAAEVANTLAPKLTEQGRSIQAASILGRLTPEGQVRFAAREILRYNETAPLAKQIPEITGEQTQFILNEMKEINAMADGVERAMRFQKLQNYIQDLTPTPLIKKVVAVWKAGLLTGLKTQGLNIFSNLFHGVSEIVKDIPAVAVDSAAALFTGKRTKSLTTKGVTTGVKEGFDKGVRYFKTGFDERNIGAKLDYRRVNFGEGVVAKAFQNYTDTVFRFLGAQDQPFYYGALARSLMDQALAQGKNLGLKGKELVKFAEKQVQAPSEEMIRYAVADATTAVFQNKTKLGEAARQIQKIPGVGEIILPFGRTPSAVAMQIVNYSPVGVAKTIIENIGKGKFDQRLFSQGIGRGLTGTAILAIGAELFKNGLVSLDYPIGDEREQELQKAEGVKPNSIKVDDKWRSPIALGPLGNVLLVGGHFQKALEEAGSPTEALSMALLGGAKSFTEQTFLTGISQAVNAITDPERYAKSYLPNLIASFVPTLVSDVSRATDPKERRAETTLQRIQKRVPGARRELEPQVDILGRERESVGNPLEIMADPSRPSPDVGTLVTGELRRLMDAGYRVSPTALGSRKGYEGLTQEQNTELWKTTGEILSEKLTALFNDPRYLQLSDDEKAEKIEEFVRKAKLYGRVSTAIKVTDGLVGTELKEKLAELKEGGLMNRQVFNKYVELR